MKTLIFGLSDIHIKINDEMLNRKRRDFSRMVIEKANNVDNIIFVINGDITNSGCETQFSLALDFLMEIIDDIENVHSNLDISIVFSPGNHDCDVSKLIDSDFEELENAKIEFKRTGNLQNYLTVMNKMKTQDNYVEFCSIFENPYIIHSNLFSEIYEYNLNVSKLNIFSLNSSVFYDKNTKQGDIYIDIDIFDKFLYKRENTINILVTHYPVEWFNRNNLSLISSITKEFDIVIYGHEHEGNITINSDADNDLLVIRNPMFNGKDRITKNGVSLIILDTDIKTCHVELLYYDGEYFLTEKTEEVKSVFSSLSQISNKAFIVNPEFQDRILYLDPLFSSDDKILMDDLIVSLPLENLIDDDIEALENETDDIMYTKNYIIDENSINFIYGKTEQGKTTFLLDYFSKLIKKQYVPIYLAGNRLNKKFDKDSFIDFIESTFIEQYTTHLDVLRQNRDKMCLLIDDFHLIKSNDLKSQLLVIIKEITNKVIITSHISYVNSDMIDSKEMNITQYKILELGQTEIYDLIENWLKLKSLDGVVDHSKLIELKNKVNQVSRNNYVPLNPFFILMLLKSDEDNETKILVDSSKKVYYEYVISKNIIEISKLIELTEGQIYMHLEELAYYYFSNKEIKFNDFVKTIQKKYRFDDEYIVESRKLKNLLLKKRVISIVDGFVNFNYPFIYFTFLARYITEKIDEKPIDIKQIIENIYDEDNANIMLFLSQYIAKKHIISLIVEESNSILSEFKEISFNNEDLEIYNLFIKDVREVKKYGSLRENNQKLNKEIDTQNRNNIIKAEGNRDIARTLTEKQKIIIKSNKMTLILNELLNSLNTHSENVVIMKTAVSLGRRTLSLFTHEYIEIMKEIIEKYRDEEEMEEEDFDVNIVKSATVFFANVFLYIASSLGSKINNPSLRELLDDNNNFDYLVLFVSGLKSLKDEDKKINITEIKKFVKKLEKSENYFCKGVMFSLLSHQLNIVGLTAKKTSELCNYFGYSNKKKKELMSKKLMIQ